MIRLPQAVQWLTVFGWRLTFCGAVACCKLALVRLAYTSEPSVKLTAPQLLPDKTLAYFRIDDVRQLRQDFERSSLGKISNDPKLKPVVDAFYGSSVRVTEETFGQIGLNLDEFLSIPSGELAVALLAAPKANRQVAARNSEDDPESDAQPKMTPPIFVTMIDAGEDISGIQVMFDRLGRTMASESEYLQKSHDRLTLHSYQNREDSQSQFAYFIDQGVLIAASSRKTIEDLVEEDTGLHYTAFSLRKE